MERVLLGKKGEQQIREALGVVRLVVFRREHKENGGEEYGGGGESEEG